MDIPEMRLVIQDKDSVTISRSEYDELKEARFALHIMGTTLTAWGVENKLALPILKSFGYEYNPKPKQEADPDA